jgi:hypothetical protein
MGKSAAHEVRRRYACRTRGGTALDFLESRQNAGMKFKQRTEDNPREAFILTIHRNYVRLLTDISSQWEMQ